MVEHSSQFFLCKMSASKPKLFSRKSDFGWVVPPGEDPAELAVTQPFDSLLNSDSNKIERAKLPVQRTSIFINFGSHKDVMSVLRLENGFYRCSNDRCGGLDSQSRRSTCDQYRQYREQDEDPHQKISRIKRAPSEMSRPIPSTVPHPHKPNSRPIVKTLITISFYPLHTTKRQAETQASHHI